MGRSSPPTAGRLMDRTRPAGARWWWLAASLAVLTGCPPPHEPSPPPQLTRRQAVDLVNRNNERISITLQAKRVRARGHFTDDENKKRSFNLEGGILFLKPRYLYFDLGQLGQTVMRFGSNAEEYWLWIQPEVDTLWWGTYAGLEEGNPEAIPIRPDLLIEALGFGQLPEAEGLDGDVVYRVMGEHNQLFWVGRDATGRACLAKEYWLDRRPPHMIRKILSRRPSGRLDFYAELDDYQPIRDSGVLAAHRIVLHWLEPDAVMDLRIGGWKPRDHVGQTSGAFTRPADRPTTLCVD